MKIVHAKKVPSVENPHKVQVGKLYDTEHAQVMHITLEPGQSLKRHITPGIVEIGDEKQEVGPDTLIDSPARIPHCWYNESAGVVRIMVVKVPRPTETTRIL
jgi:quercetin dioxygenase-like cupin family protein